MNGFSEKSEKRDIFQDIITAVMKKDPEMSCITKDSIHIWYQTFGDAIGTVSDEVMLNTIKTVLAEEDVESVAGIVNHRLNKYADAVRRLENAHVTHQIDDQQFNDLCKHLNTVSPDLIMTNLTDLVIK